VTRVLSIVLAGGEGKRLLPLTLDRAKPAVPFGGQYRLVDFVLSNLANAGFLRIVVLTQYKSHSLDLHISRTWPMSSLLGTYVAPVPAQMRRGPRWFAGSADAIFQNLNIIGDENPEHLCVFGADHIYRMDPRQMLEQHVASGAGVTVAAIRVPVGDADQFGIIQAGAGGRIRSFLEKPSSVPGLDDDPSRVFASMGNYIFRTDRLLEMLHADAEDDSSRHDIGGDLIPRFVGAEDAVFYDFADNEVPGATERDRGYWRDVGTLDSYYKANMELVSVHPVFNLYNRQWPIYTAASQLPPAKFVFEENGRTGRALDSIVGAGSIVAGGLARRSVLSPGVLIEAGAVVEDSVIMNDVSIGPDAVVQRAIIDKNVRIPAGARIGTELAPDNHRFVRSPEGIVVIGKGEVVEP
jgi:glucose-1-phosphate adenylyltransferase